MKQYYLVYHHDKLWVYSNKELAQSLLKEGVDLVLIKANSIYEADKKAKTIAKERDNNG